MCSLTQQSYLNLLLIQLLFFSLDLQPVSKSIMSTCQVNRKISLPLFQFAKGRALASHLVYFLLIAMFQFAPRFQCRCEFVHLHCYSVNSVSRVKVYLACTATWQLASRETFPLGGTNSYWKSRLTPFSKNYIAKFCLISTSL